MSTPDFFRSRLDAMIDLRHPLAVLANRMPRSLIEATLTPMFERRAREGRMSAEVDLFGVTPKLAGAGVSAAERPRLSVRLMVGLLYLKHAYNESEAPRVRRRPPSLALRRACVQRLFPIVSVLCFGRRDIAEWAEQATLVIPMDPFECRQFDCF